MRAIADGQLTVGGRRARGRRSLGTLGSADALANGGKHASTEEGSTIPQFTFYRNEFRYGFRLVSRPMRVLTVAQGSAAVEYRLSPVRKSRFPAPLGGFRIRRSNRKKKFELENIRTQVYLIARR